jgi:hypothetical protein
MVTRYPWLEDLERCAMAKGPSTPGSPEAWEIDDLSRMRRVHEDLDREYRLIPEGHYRRQAGGNVPSLIERSARRPSRGEP